MGLKQCTIAASANEPLGKSHSPITCVFNSAPYGRRAYCRVYQFFVDTIDIVTTAAFKPVLPDDVRYQAQP